MNDTGFELARIGKRTRKTIGFGHYDKKEREYEDEVYIRELSIGEGGLGCALWDAALYLTRWIHGRLDLFGGKLVYELGAGVGAPSIVAGRAAARVVATDYMENITQNLAYNIWLNSKQDDHDTEDIGSLSRAQKNRRSYKPRVDIIVGSELTYSNKSTHSLCWVMDALLAHDGVCYMINSTDREGVADLVQRAEGLGYTVICRDVPFGALVGQLTGQRSENYRCLTITRQPATHAVFGE